jgi:biotin carboxyl carrier protein
MKDYKLKINGNAYSVTVSDVEDNFAEVEVNGIPFKVEFENPVKKNIVTPPKTSSSIVSPSSTVQKPSVQVTPPSFSTVINVTSPLPGIILEVAVKEGDIVKKGQKLIVLEAMKMENVIEASADGKIISVKVSKGDSVLEGATLVTIG